MKDLTIIQYYTQTWIKARTCRCLSLTRQPVMLLRWRYPAHGGGKGGGEPSLQNKQKQTTHTNYTIICLGRLFTHQAKTAGALHMYTHTCM